MRTLTVHLPKFLEETLESAIFSIKGKIFEAAIGIARACYGSRFKFDEHRVLEKRKRNFVARLHPSAFVFYSV